MQKTVLSKSTGVDANPIDHRVFKIINPAIKNPTSGNPVGYKFEPLPTQKLLASPGSIQAQRALFTNHHVWVTKYKDEELYAAGRFTLQSQLEQGGVHDMAARRDDVEDEDLVVWNCFGLTHNPRYVLVMLLFLMMMNCVTDLCNSVEDWPVMPVEIYQIHFKPSDFFDRNPAIDVPSTKNDASVLVGKDCCSGEKL